MGDGDILVVIEPEHREMKMIDRASTIVPTMLIWARPFRSASYPADHQIVPARADVVAKLRIPDDKSFRSHPSTSSRAWQRTSGLI
jgi:hypothetical protein